MGGAFKAFWRVLGRVGRDIEDMMEMGRWIRGCERGVGGEQSAASQYITKRQDYVPHEFCIISD